MRVAVISRSAVLITCFFLRSCFSPFVGLPSRAQEAEPRPDALGLRRAAADSSGSE
jgi:hypothetical protein